MAVEKPNLVIYGRVIALSPVTEIPSREANKPAMKKRELYVDCTRYDSITGIRDERENKPLFEIGGDKLLEKVAALNLQKGDVIAIKFAIQHPAGCGRQSLRPSASDSCRPENP